MILRNKIDLSSSIAESRAFFCDRNQLFLEVLTIQSIII